MRCSVKFKILSLNDEIIALKERIKEILINKNALISETLIDFQVFFNQENPGVESNPLLILKLTWVHDYNIFLELNLMDVNSMKNIPDYDLEELCQEFSDMVGHSERKEDNTSNEFDKEEDFYDIKPKKKKGFFSIFKKREDENPFL